MSAQQSQPQGIPPAAQIMQLIWPGALAAQAIYVAAKLGVADLLGSGPQGIDELAKATKTHERSLYRLLRALTSLGIFEEVEPEKFQNTAPSAALRTDIPGSVQPWPLFLFAPFNWKLWGSLEDTVRTGEAGAERVYGSSFWEYLAQNPRDAAVFNAAMSSRSEMLGGAVTAAYDFSRFKKIVDVGGGQGRLLHSILSGVPGLHGVLFDLPQVAANAAFLQRHVAEGRAAIVGGSFLETVPGGADAYVLSGILNDWDDEHALRILANCRRAIPNGGRLLIVTSILKTAAAPADRGSFMDIYMMLYGGRERTAAEFQALLRQAGFSILRVIPTSTLNLIIECEPASAMPES